MAAGFLKWKIPICAGFVSIGILPNEFGESIAAYCLVSSPVKTDAG
jgi:hypothetical protein